MAPIKNRHQKPVCKVAQGRWIWSVLMGHTFTNGAPLTPPTTPDP